MKSALKLRDALYRQAAATARVGWAIVGSDGSALSMLVQSGKLSLEIWLTGGCRAH
jgi:hypothetical protein